MQSNNGKNIASTLVILNNIHSSLNSIKQFSYDYLFAVNDSELTQETWVEFSDTIDLKMHDDEGVIKIEAYPVIDGQTITSDWVSIGALPTYALDFDALEFFQRDKLSDLTPNEIALTNVIEHIIEQIEYFKDLSSSKDLITADEFYAIYEKLTKKKAH